MPLPVVTRESPFINALERIRHTKGHQALVKKATPQQIEALEEIIQNILENENITTASFKKRLRPKARHFREFVHKRTSLKRKKRLLNQQGSGLIPTIRGVIPHLKKSGLVV